jgi:ATP-dependent DNA ligase
MTKAPPRNDRDLVQPVSARQPDFGLPLDLPPMDARTAETLPDFEGPWQYEPKWDGFRCLAFKAGGTVELRAKSGKPLGRFFPEIVALLAGNKSPAWSAPSYSSKTMNGPYSAPATRPWKQWRH